jgi:hypothetical protein
MGAERRTLRLIEVARRGIAGNGVTVTAVAIVVAIVGGAVFATVAQHFGL